MTLEEAFNELGLAPSATPEEVRRAYLRGVKIRKPETDPEGFRRLREAYEIVTGGLTQRVMPPPPPPGKTDDGEVPPDVKAMAEKLSKLLPETHLDERLALIREAISRHPALSQLRSLLILELDRVKGREAELEEAIRQADAQGLRGFLGALAVRFPDRVGPDGLRRLEASRDPDLLALAGRVHLVQSRPEQAVAALGRAVDRVTGPDGANKVVPTAVPSCILALEAAGLAADARALHDRLWTWLSSAGDAALLARWGAVHSWNVLHELGLLDPSFPPELRQMAAHVALGEKEPREAKEEAEYLRDLDGQRTGRAAAMLQGLPMLQGLYYLSLAVPERHQTISPILLLLLLAGALLLPVLLGLLDRSPSDTPKEQRIAATRGQMMQGQAAAAWDLLRAGCDGPEPSLPREACELARQAVQKTRTGDCWGAHDALDKMSAALQRAGKPDLEAARGFEKRMLSALENNCGTPSEL